MRSVTKLVLATALVAMWPRAASAGELLVAPGVSVAATSWEDEAAGYGDLHVGWRWARFGVDFVGREGYAAIDERVLSYFSLGGSVWIELGATNAYARLALVHQHEEPLAAVYADPFGVVFGVGDGIRHRGGGAASVGVDVPLTEWGGFPISLDVHLSATGFPDDRGPRWYVGGGLGLRLRWQPK